MTGHTQSYPDNPELRQDAAKERQFLEENIATVAFHLGQPGAKLSVRSDKGALMVDPGEVLKEISRRLTVTDSPSRPGRITEDQIMQVIRKVTSGELREILTCKRWKDGIDIDRPTFAAERLAEEFGALAISSTEGK
jgi:hypothetical protein